MKRRGALVSELIFLYLIIDTLNLIFFKEDLGFKQIPVSPYWIPILMVASRYGLLAGLISGLLSAGHVLYFEYGYLPTRNQLEVAAEARGLILPIAFVLVGIFLGGVRQRFSMDHSATLEALERAQVSREVMERRYQSSEEARKAIEAKVVGQTSTVRTLYDISVHFESLDEGEIYSGFVETLANHFEVTRCSVFIREGEYFILRAAHGWGEQEVFEGKVRGSETAMELAYMSNYPIFAHALSELRATLPPDASSYLALFPIRDTKGAPIGVAAVEQMSFLALTQSNLELIGLIVDWMNRALANRSRIERLQEMAIWDERLRIYSAKSFRECLRHEFFRARLLDQELSIAILQIEYYPLLQKEARRLVSQTVAGLLQRHLTEPAVSFVYDYEGVFAVVAPSTPLSLLSGKLARLQEEFLSVIRVESDDSFAQYLPRLIEGSAQLGRGMESDRDLELAALRASGIDGEPAKGERSHP